MITPLNFILLLIIVFVFFKLRSVLGMRNPEDYKSRPPHQPPPHQETDKPEESGPTIDQESVSESASEEVPESGRGIALLRQHQPDFDEAQFLSGAGKAYSLILTAFADDDLEQVKDLLSADVYEGFAAALAAYKSEGKALMTQIITLHRPRLEDALIIESGTDLLNVQLEVRFRAEILSYVVAQADKAALQKMQDTPTDMNPHTSDDLWVFEQTLTKGGRLSQKWQLTRTGD